MDDRLRSQYNVTDEDLGVISISAARFMKTWLSHGTKPDPLGTQLTVMCVHDILLVVDLCSPLEGEVNPMACTGDAPWDPLTHTLRTSAGPGQCQPSHSTTLNCSCLKNGI